MEEFVQVCYKRRLEEGTALESWIAENSICANLDESKVDGVLKLITYRLEQTELQSLKYGSSLDYSEYHLLANRLLKMYIHLKRGQSMPFLAEMSIMEETLQECCEAEAADLEYVAGIKYVFTSLKLEAVKCGQELNPGTLTREEAEEKAEDLSARGCVAINGLKFYFIYDYAGTDYVGARQMLKQLMQAEGGKNPEWHVASYLCYKHERQTKMTSQVTHYSSSCMDYWSKGPGEREVEEIQKAKRLVGKTNNPYVEYANISCLAAIIQDKCGQSQESPSSAFKYGTLQFKNVDQAVGFLKKQTMKTLKSQGFSASTYCKLAGIYYKTLPWQYADFELSKKLLEKAVEKSPDSARIYHRLGLMSVIRAKVVAQNNSGNGLSRTCAASRILACSPRMNGAGRVPELDKALLYLEEAAVYLKEAYERETDGNQVFLLRDLLFVLIGNFLNGGEETKIPEYLTVLEKIEMPPPVYPLDFRPKVCEGDLILLNGVYLMIKGDEKAAATKIIEAVGILNIFSSSKSALKHFQSRTKWYLWDLSTQTSVFARMEESIRRANASLEHSSIATEGIRTYCKLQTGLTTNWRIQNFDATESGGSMDFWRD